MADRYGGTRANVHGSCKGNGQEGARGGIGVDFGSGNPNNISAPLPGDRQTNNRAALEAARQAVESAKQQGHRDLTVESNSEYLTKNASDHLSGWQQQGWRKNDGGQLKNVDKWQGLQEASKGMDVRYKHQPGPSNSQQLSRDGAGGSKYYK